MDLFEDDTLPAIAPFDDPWLDPWDFNDDYDDGDDLWLDDDELDYFDDERWDE